MAWDTGLTGIHLAIAAYPASPLRVLAGPGTGKTFALMRRVARLLETGVAPESILAVTFTRTAAHDLVGKLTELGVPGADQVMAKTLHGLSFSILGRAAVFQVTGRVPRPLLGHEQEMMVGDLKEQFGGKKNVRSLIKAFEAFWARLQHQEPGWPRNARDRAFNIALRSWLRFHEAILVGELVPLAYGFVRNNPQHPNVPSYAHVLVDEYQDLNRADQALIDALAQNANVIIVGDEDQSIYGFRHANPEGIVEYPRTHNNTHDEALVECRRCPRLIVRLASSLIDHNERNEPKNLTACPTNENGTVYIVQHQSLGHEIDCIAAYIEHYLLTHPDLRAGEILVLSSRRIIGNGIRDALNQRAQQNRRAWSASSFYFEDALDSDEAAIGFSILTLLAVPTDRAALRVWLGAQSQDGLAHSYARLRTYCEANGVTPYDAALGLVSGAITIPHTAVLRARFAALTERLATLQNATVQQIVDDIFPANVAACADVRGLALTAMPEVGAARELLDELRVLITQPEIPGSQGTAVRIMSLYKSKGLTAKVTIIAGCVGGILPRIDFDVSIQEQERQREEQRRLFYVGITRSTDTLILSHAVHMSFAMAKKAQVAVVRRAANQVILQASEFLAELGPNAPAPISGTQWRRQLNF
jgi:DNA helicase-2/ATP-dependent DNA helicase PcrA